MGENKIGLVLEGGGMRGMYTCGILDVLMNEGIEFGGAAGVSAGAAFGCNYKSRQPGRALRYNKRFAGDPRYSGLRSLLRTGNLFNAEFCYHVVPTEYDVFDTATFASNPMAFYAVCMDVDTGKAVYHRCTDGGYTDLEWIRASASMPIVSRVVEIDGHRYLDGGLADNIPLEFMQQQGYARNVVILTQADDYRKQQSRAMPIARFLLRHYPAVVKALENRPAHYNEQVEQVRECERAGNALVFRPDTSLAISRTCSDTAEMERVYNLGRTQALARLDEVKEFVRF